MADPTPERSGEDWSKGPRGWWWLVFRMIAEVSACLVVLLAVFDRLDEAFIPSKVGWDSALPLLFMPNWFEL